MRRRIATVRTDSIAEPPPRAAVFFSIRSSISSADPRRAVVLHTLTSRAAESTTRIQDPREIRISIGCTNHPKPLQSDKARRLLLTFRAPAIEASPRSMERISMNGPILPWGEFYGTANVKRELPGFSLSRMSPIVPAEEMQTHLHPDATVVVILDGIYLSSALNAGPRCGAPTLIYNPPGTTHRDRFQQLSVQFLGIPVQRKS